MLKFGDGDISQIIHKKIDGKGNSTAQASVSHMVIRADLSRDGTVFDFQYTIMTEELSLGSDCCEECTNKYNCYTQAMAEGYKGRISHFVSNYDLSFPRDGTHIDIPITNCITFTLHFANGYRGLDGVFWDFDIKERR